MGSARMRFMSSTRPPAVGTAAGLHTVAVADDAPDKPQMLGDAVGLADASIAGLILDPREREQATPTPQLTEAGNACVDAEADAWVSVNTRGVNHGADVELVVAAGGQDTAESYVRFKTDFIPADADVVAASLEADLILQTGGQPPVLQAVVDAADAEQARQERPLRDARHRRRQGAQARRRAVARERLARRQTPEPRPGTQQRECNHQPDREPLRQPREHAHDAAAPVRRLDARRHRDAGADGHTHRAGDGDADCLGALVQFR
jgi:hypothetical protein